jgi:hypothetical protein
MVTIPPGENPLLA